MLPASQLLSQAGPIKLHSSNCFGGFSLNSLQLVYKSVLNLDSSAKSWSSELPAAANPEACMPSVVGFGVFFPPSLSHFSPPPANHQHRGKKWLCDTVYFVCRVQVYTPLENRVSYLNFWESDGRELNGGIN